MLAATSNAFVASQFLGNCHAAVPGNSGKATSVNKRQINKKLSPPRDISMATVDRQTEVALSLCRTVSQRDQQEGNGPRDQRATRAVKNFNLKSDDDKKSNLAQLLNTKYHIFPTSTIFRSW